jgi:hypothetical protein
MKTNISRTNATSHAVTHEGAPALRNEDPIARLVRVLNAHLLWEDSFYVDGAESANILALATEQAIAFDPGRAGLAIIHARKVMNIRHASLMAAVIYARTVKGSLGRALLTNVISRADELAEALAMNAQLSGGSVKRFPHAVRHAVADAFQQFDAYQFGKYKGAGNKITLRDAVFLTHPKREDGLIKAIVKDTIPVPDTWEVGLSAGGDKREVFENLLRENRLGAMALLRNLRNMDAAGVDEQLIANAFALARWEKVLPFRFIAAVKAAPRFSRLLQDAFADAKAGQETLGSANVCIDVSGSMGVPISVKSTIHRAEAAAALAVCWPGPYRLWVFGDSVKEMPAFGRLADIRITENPDVGHGTRIDLAVAESRRANPGADYTVVVSDMQGAASVGVPAGQGVMVNVAPYRNGIAADGPWQQLSGFSERVYEWLRASRPTVAAT